MSSVLSIFQNPSAHQKEFIIDTKVEVLDWGNVDALKAGIKDPAKIKEYMEKLQREREGKPPLEEKEGEGEEKAEGEEKKDE